ncbi:MAG: nitroreductase family protein [Bacteriovorax sp.]|nr:nitroreductase family protein [Bacteriovorax sp.]
MSKNVFTEMDGKFSGNDKFQNEGANYFNPEAFKELVHARRSIRKFSSEKIPDAVVDECIDMALLAPNSSNLQTWEFYRIKSEQVKKDIVYACFSQPAAATASELIVCVARPSKWRDHCKQMLETFKALPVETPKSAIVYYSKLAPFVYTVGFLNSLTPLKWIFNTIVGIFKVVPREPISSFGLALWSIKSCALAAENLMLAFRAHGFDTCPMEGFDSHRVKKAMGLKGDARIVMIVGAGKRADGGAYGPRVRFPREQFIRTI